LFFVEFVLPESPTKEKVDTFSLANLLNSYFFEIKKKLFNDEDQPTPYFKRYWEQLKSMG
jgi:hypothetical protein